MRRWVHAAVVAVGLLLGRRAGRREPRRPRLAPGDFFAALLEAPQQLNLIVTRLQVDRFPRGRRRDERRTLAGAFDVDKALRLSRTFRRLWKRRESWRGYLRFRF